MKDQIYTSFPYKEFRYMIEPLNEAGVKSLAMVVKSFKETHLLPPTVVA